MSKHFMEFFIRIYAIDAGKYYRKISKTLGHQINYPNCPKRYSLVLQCGNMSKRCRKDGK